MVRFVTISQDELSGPGGDAYKKSFAFFNTIIDQFEMWGGEHIWEKWNDFESAFKSEDTRLPELERRKALCPEWVFK